MWRLKPIFVVGASACLSTEFVPCATGQAHSLFNVNSGSKDGDWRVVVWVGGRLSVRFGSTPVHLYGHRLIYFIFLKGSVHTPIHINFPGTPHPK